MPHLLWPGQWFDDDGDPIASGTLYFYTGGTSTPRTDVAFPTYDDAVAGTNTLGSSTTLDAAGRKQVWLTDDPVKVNLKDADGAQITGWPKDDIYGLAGTSTSTMTINSALFLPDDVQLKFGNTAASPDAYIEWDTAQTPDALLIYANGGAAGAAVVVETPTASDTIVFKPGGTTTLTIAGGAITSASYISLSTNDTYFYGRQTGGTYKELIGMNAADKIEIDGNANGVIISASGGAVGFFGTAPQSKQAHIADPSGGGTQDAEARTAIGSILTALETYGLLATS